MTRDPTDTASPSHPTLDDQILAYIEAAKLSDKNAKLEDFQLRMLGTDLILFNLKTRRSYILYDEDDEPLGQRPELRAIAKAESGRMTESMATSIASIVARSASHLLKWLARRQTVASRWARTIAP